MHKSTLSSISNDTILERIKRIQLFKPDFGSMFMDSLKIELTAKGFDLDSLLPALIASTSHLMRNSTVSTFVRGKNDFVVQTFLGGYSYIGVLTYVTNILCEIEKFDNVSFEESSLLGSEHGEHLLGALERNNNIIGLYDNRFISLYRNDRQMVNTLSVAPKFYDFSIKNVFKKRIDRPHFNFFAHLHYSEVYQVINEQFSQTAASFMHKAYVTCPMISQLNYTEINQANKKQCVFLKPVLYFISKIHTISREYTFSEDSASLLNDLWDTSKNALTKIVNREPYIGQLLGDSFGKATKLAAILHIIELAYTYLSTIKIAYEDELSEKLDLRLIDYLLELQDSAFIINKHTLIEAIQLNEYYNITQICLLGLGENFDYDQNFINNLIASYF